MARKTWMAQSLPGRNCCTCTRTTNAEMSLNASLRRPLKVRLRYRAVQGVRQPSNSNSDGMSFPLEGASYGESRRGNKELDQQTGIYPGSYLSALWNGSRISGARIKRERQSRQRCHRCRGNAFRHGPAAAAADARTTGAHGQQAS